MYRVFSVPGKSVAEIQGMIKPDHPVSRQSIAIRDGQSLGFKGKGTLVIIEGHEAALRLAEELFKGVGTAVPAAEAEKVVRALKAQEDSATSGMGMIFG